MPALDLTGRTAWITGASRNIGKSIAVELATSGADVVLSNRTKTRELTETIEEIRSWADSDVTGVQLDVGTPESVSDAVEEIHRSVGTVDILVNNAAIRPHTPVQDISIEEWNDVIRTNLTGPFLCTQAVLADLRDAGAGRVISVFGSDAYFGHPYRLHVTSTKAAMLGFTRGLAQELADDGVTVNCIVPGIVDTDRQPGTKSVPDYDRYRSHIPLDYICAPDEIAPTVAFLCSDGARYITGQAVHVNGGLFPTVQF